MVDWMELESRMGALEKSGWIAIDGRCGSGKSTLAIEMAHRFGGQIIKLDDFYLPSSERTPNWMEFPGGNLDAKRLQQEVLAPLRNGRKAIYRPYLCQSGAFGIAKILEPNRMTIVEGSYSHLPTLGIEVNLRIFLTCDQMTQERRLKLREGERYCRFQKLWIPLEERYFIRDRIEEQADLRIDTSDLE